MPEIAVLVASPVSARGRGRLKPLGVDAAFSNIAQRQAANAADSSTAKSYDNRTSDGKVVSLSAMPKAASVKAKLKANNVKTKKKLELLFDLPLHLEGRPSLPLQILQYDPHCSSP